MTAMKYSIITPVYNREDCIARCLESVVRNLKPGIEIEHIVVDDGSHDKTAEVVREYAKKYKHILFVQFPENRGTNAARNAAIKAAKGDFCILLDSDDYFVDDAVGFINSIVSASRYKAYMFAPDDMVEYYSGNYLLSGKYSVRLFFSNFLRNELGGDFIHCISTEILKNNLFDEKLRVFEAVFFLMFFKEAQTMLFTNRVVTIRERSRGDSVTRTMIASNKETIKKYYQANHLRYRWFLEDYIQLGEFNSLTTLLNGQLYYSLLLQKRDKAIEWRNELKKRNLPINTKNQILFKLRLGGTLLLSFKFYFALKYKILKSKLS